MRVLLFYVEQCAHCLRPAVHLKRKLAEANLHLPRVTVTLEMLEEAITKHLGEEKLLSWKEEEKEWLAKVVVVEEKKDLSNPYDLSPRSGQSALVRVVSGADVLRSENDEGDGGRAGSQVC